MERLKTILTDTEKLTAWQKRDASYDGLFFFGVKTTGIFCRPSCSSRPKPEHVEFFNSIGEAIHAGYRPCKRCQPELANGQPPEWVARLLSQTVEAPDQRITSHDLRNLGVAPEQVRRWFQKHYGMTFTAWCRGLRLARAFTQLRNGESIDHVIFENGYESHSGFREAFTRVFEQTPGQACKGDCLFVALLETPLGSMLAVVSHQSVYQLEFADRRMLKKTYTAIQHRFSLPVLPGENTVMKQLRTELQEYFQGKRQKFTVPITMHGTSFQTKIWQELQCIPYGETASYETIAQKIGTPAAVRAVARANALNPIYLLVPCHRVIAKNGTLSGYGGGVWRKRLLLKLEHTTKGIH